MAADPAPSHTTCASPGRARAGFLLGRKQVRQHLDDGDLGAERPPCAGELHPDGPAAEDDHRARHPVQGQRVLAGCHPVAVDLNPRQAARLRSAGQHHVRAADDLLAHPHLYWRRQPTLAIDHVDLAAGNQPGQALPEPGDHLVLTGIHGRHADAVQGALNAKRGALPGLVGDLGRVQQRLGGDATAVQAGAADLVFLHERHTLAELGGPQCTGVTRASTAKHHDVARAARRWLTHCVSLHSLGAALLPQRSIAWITQGPAAARLFVRAEADLLEHPGVAIGVSEVGDACAVAALRVGAGAPTAFPVVDR